MTPALLRIVDTPIDCAAYVGSSITRLVNSGEFDGHVTGHSISASTGKPSFHVVYPHDDDEEDISFDILSESLTRMGPPRTVAPGAAQNRVMAFRRSVESHSDAEWHQYSLTC